MRNTVCAMLATLAVSILVLSGCGSKEPKPKSNPEAEKAAIESATVWLQLVDSEKYAESWEEAAEYLKNAVSKDNFQTSLQAVREPLGKLVSRNLKSKVYTTSAPGAPDGEYVIIQYNTSFENKESALETVTPMRDKDGIWRVSGYYIR